MSEPSPKVEARDMELAPTMQPVVAKISKGHWLPFPGETAKMGPREEADGMTLSEKILALRTEKNLSQGDLAEKLEVSRQSVSKWETGQSVPELDKLIKLADLFGVSVDTLVREGDAPQPAPEPPGADAPTAAAPETKIVYVERRRLSGTQTAGAVLLVLGLLSVILGVAVSGNSGTYTAMAGAGMVVLGLPLLLAREHPFLIIGWVVLAVSCLILNPHTSISPWGLWGGLRMLWLCLKNGYATYTYGFAAAVGIVRGLLALALLVFTARACWKRCKSREEQRVDPAE